MANSNHRSLAHACGCALLLCLAACGPRHSSVATVADLMDDKVTLDGLLMKCNRNPAGAGADSDCINARVASERLAARNDAAQEAKRTEEFERHREKLRVADEQRRRDEESRKVDAYHLPVVPLDPAAAAAEAPPSAAQP